MNQTHQQLNARKKELLDQQELALQKAVESKNGMSATEKARFDNMSRELNEINISLGVGIPKAATERKPRQFYSLAGAKTGETTLSMTDHQCAEFHRALKTPTAFQAWQISNSALGESGSPSSDGSALVPIATDPTIPNLAMAECSARSLSKVLVTKSNINIPFQSARSVAAIKAESNNSGTNAFGTSVPGFATTLLQSYVVGNGITISWELLSDSVAANAFLPAELMRAVRTEEESLFISGSGSGQPQGYIGNGTPATGASVTAGAATLGINPILDQVASLNRSYFANAHFLMSRQTFYALAKAQVAANQLQVWTTWDALGNARLLGYPVEFSTECPTYVASPEVNGWIGFGDFASYACIGDRDSSDIRVKVLSEVGALNATTTLLAYRRTDQRIVLAEACIELLING